MAKKGQQADTSKSRSKTTASDDLAHAYQALKENERNCRLCPVFSLIENTGHPITVFDGEGKLLLINRPGTENLGQSSDNLVGKSVYELFPDTAADMYIRRFRHVISSGKGSEHEDQVELPAGKKWFWSNIQPVKDASGKAYAVQIISHDITERKEIEHALRSSEEKFRTLVETANAAIFIFQGTKNRFVNPVAESLTGYSQKELLAMDFWEIMHPDFQDMVKERGLARQRSEVAPFSYEVKIVRKDGEERWLEFNAARIEYHGRAAILGVAHDITEYKQMEKALRDSEAHLKKAQEMVHIGYWDWDPNSGELIWSDEIYRILGFEPNEVVPSYELFLDMVHPDDKDFLNKSVEAALYQNKPYELDCRIVRKDGSERVVHALDEVKFDKDGKPLRMVGLFQEITERKRAEEKLAISESRFRALFQSAGDYALVLEMQMEGPPIIIDANDMAFEKHGYSRDEMIGKPISFLDSKSSKKKIDERLEQVKKGGLVHFEVEHICKDGSKFTAEVAVRLIEHQGKILFFSVERDISERKRTEDELQFRAELESMITSISTEFINLPSTEIDAGIDRALRAIGEFLDVDRSYVFQFRDQLTKMDNTHEWCADGIEAHIDRLQDLQAEDFPWAVKKMRKKEGFNIPCVADLPPEAAREKKEFELEGIQSIICVPTISAGKVVGFMGFDSVRRQRTWPEDIATLLKMVGVIVALALERKETEEKLEHMAHSDNLTGLPNRALFFDRLAQSLVRARRRKQDLAVLFVDLDRFKAINDALGHDVGDIALKQVAQRLRHCVREEDTIARMGGDEFTIILTELEKPDNAALVSQKILASLTEPFMLKGKEWSLGCSIGIAIYPSDGKDSEALLKRADTAMYRAKQKGNKYSFCS